MFRAVPPEEVLDLWQAVEPGLAAIKRRCDAPWFTPQIRAHLLDDRATLCIRNEAWDVTSGRWACDGFVVIERCREMWTSEPYMNVWFMWFRPGEGMKLRDELVKWLDGAARHLRCVWWQFGSPREEWGSTIAPYCEKTLTIWRRKT